MELTGAVLKAILPRCPQPDQWAEALNPAMARFAIDSPERAAAFLAQVGHESAQLGRLSENLNYSAAQLMKVWPARFPTVDVAKQFERNPEKLANRVYASRLGNGDATSGDGWHFRGRGLIQLTGRGNYRAAAKAIDQPLEQQPDLILQPGPAALAAAWFWQSHGLNELADDKSDDNDNENFITITRRINGGTVGLKERLVLWDRAKGVLVG